ncbi:MFS transporter [Agaricicola taiwanensis]|uniref:MFS transporter n=1 Tax=Agaricicola taiwanensis TaxID=591372 RepID=A0A8J2YLZ4_9RHOB|nr:YbfB/YjiJ family MFS transporter [Agaricicola taiwanensis]GGE51989.1 MFS transporter [Agaricicola taiwanensis]
MLRSVLAFAIAATFLGLGLGRFAFSPLIPELIAARWVEVSAAQAIGAANLIGYLVGALAAAPAVRLMPERVLCLASGILVVLSYAMFFAPLGLSWFWLARFLAGVGGGVLMVVGTAASGRQLAVLGKRRFQPILFTGLGLGALFAALFLPYLIEYGVEASIFVLLALSTAALAVLWASSGFPMKGIGPAPTTSARPSRPSPTVILVLLAYGCEALGFVMHTVYLPDMLRRNVGYSEVEIGVSWAFFGIGACAGPLIVLLMRRVMSDFTALWSAFLVKAAGVSLVLVTTSLPAASLSLFIVGALTPGIVILTSGALSLSAPPDRYLKLWAAATAIFALGQMTSGMIIAAISAEGYLPALILSVTVLLVGATLAFLAQRLIPREVQT